MENPFEQLSNRLFQIEELLNDLPSKIQGLKSSHSKEFLSFKEVVELYNVSRGTIYNLHKKGHLQVYKSGKKSLIKSTEIQSYFERNRV